MAKGFRELLKGLIEQRGFRIYSAFCAHVAGDKLADTEHSTHSPVLAGKRAAPIHHVEKWGAALKLSGAELDRSIWLAIADHLPSNLRAHWVGFFEDHFLLHEKLLTTPKYQWTAS